MSFQLIVLIQLVSQVCFSTSFTTLLPLSTVAPFLASSSRLISLYRTKKRRGAGRLDAASFLYDDDWKLLSPAPGGVWKQTLSEGDGPNPSKDSDMEISYKGTLIGEDWWTAQDVADCWISELQGMDAFALAIIENNVDGSSLLNPDVFTEDFVMEKLDISNKIQCKKLIMASRRLQKVRDEFPIGYEFDANSKFEISPSKRIIRGMRLGIENMRVGETAKIICRSDYAYGGEGMRKSNGDVLIPPFATLSFEVTLLNAILDS